MLNQYNRMMKKLLLTFAIALLSVSGMLAQQPPLVLTHAGEPLGDTVVIWGEPTAFEIVCYADVTNTTNRNMNIKAARKEISLVNNTWNQICWAGLCYSPSTDTSVNYLLIKAGETASGANEFSGHYTPSGQIGTTVIEFTFYNIDNPAENVSVVVKFWASPVGIAEDVMKGGKISDAYPNPATSFINVDYQLTTEVEQAKVRIINLLGAVVSESEIEPSGNNLKIDVSNLESGVYFYSVLVNGDIYKTKKLIIR
jgi:hypothetical protein